MRALGPGGSTLYDSLSVIPVNSVEQMTTRVKSYIYLEIANEGRKIYKELKKEVHEGKKSEQCPPKLGHDDQKCRLLLSSPRREAYEKFTPLNQEIPVILVEMERRDWLTSPTPRNNDAPMRSLKA